MKTRQEDYQIRLPFFQGPLDLLLYLIKTKELEIEEISISLITADFLRYVEHYKASRHQYIAEFLQMAATLLYVKSLSLIPVNENLELDEDLEDPRKAIVFQLIEYQRVKKMMAFLESKKNGLIIERSVNNDLSEIKSQVEYKEAAEKDLIDCYLKFFNPSRARYIIDKTRRVIIRLEDKIKWLSRLVKEKVRLSFFKLIKKLSRKESILVLQASLEMAKQEEVRLSQEELFDDITIEGTKDVVSREQEKIA